MFIVTEKNGVPAADFDERVLCVTTTDYQTGRRYIKGLKEIEVKHAD